MKIITTMSNKEDLKDKVFLVKSLYSNSDFNEALKLTSILTKNYSNNSFILNLHGVVLIALNNLTNPFSAACRDSLEKSIVLL